MFVAGCLALSGGAIAQTQSGTPGTTTQGGAAMGGPTQGGTTPSGTMQNGATDKPGDQLDGGDRRFLENAAQGGHAEVEGSKMAQEKAKSATVKQFAEQMIQDHTKVNEELAALAKQKGYTPPTEPSLMQRAELKTLSMTDDSFDKMYASRIGVAAHEDTLKMFQDAAANAKDPDIKAFAAKHVPALQKHLEMAKAMQQEVDGKK
jgi:putative membrane protein